MGCCCCNNVNENDGDSGFTSYDNNHSRIANVDPSNTKDEFSLFEQRITKSEATLVNYPDPNINEQNDGANNQNNKNDNNSIKVK